MRTDRIWLIGGAVGAAALLAIGWVFLIGPQHGQTGKLKDQADAAQLRLSELEHHLADLRQQNGDLPKYRAQLAVDRQALPRDSGLPDFLRELHAATDGQGSTFNLVAVGAVAKVAGTATPVYSVPLTLNVEGTTATVNRFLDQLQQVQPRAALITGVTTLTGSANGHGALTLTLQLFVAPAIGESTPPN
jgi:type IV pilus assembly protein PilO